MSDMPTGPSETSEPGFPGFEPPSPVAAPASGAYRVLARKYRPRSFDDLIGQEAMVRTLSNAFSSGRIPQAWMLTGVRGVGKTTTARILARALNYELPDGSGGPTIHMPTLGVHCEAIMESRHVDVMEMDAASHTGIDDVRQITDGVRYGPVSARMKVYIIDEVHMLSDKAFNAFLKTLEEPPPHAKFVFATTEIRKVPVTILSRCQRFDLRRVEAGRLVEHLRGICAAEDVSAQDEALAAIARAAEGSVRDALSLLDQAIAHGAGHVTADGVRDMMGLADRARIIDLFEAAMKGDIAAALNMLREQYDAGADPAVILTDLASFTHLVTRLKLTPDAGKDPALSEAERIRGADFAARLSIRILSRAWQMITKSLPEVQGAARPLPAAEMALVRLAYAADLPTPDEALRELRDNPAGSGSTAPALSPSGGGASAMSGGARPMMIASSQPAPIQAPTAIAAAAAPTLKLARFEDLVALAGEKRDIALKAALESDVRLVRFEDGILEFALTENGSRSLAADVSRKLQDWTGRRWMVAVVSGPGEATLRERAKVREDERRSDAEAHPLVRAVLQSFPGAKIVDIRERGAEAAPTPPDMPADSDETYETDDSGARFDDEPPFTLDD